MFRRPSLATTNDSGAGTVGTTGTGSGIPTSITIVTRPPSSFVEDSSPTQPKRSLETPPLPDDDATCTTGIDTFNESPVTPSSAEDRTRTISQGRMSTLMKRASSSSRRDGLLFLMDSSTTNDTMSISKNRNNRRGSDPNDSKRRHFQRAASSRKSFSLMIQHANLQQQQQQQQKAGSARNVLLMSDMSMKSVSKRQRRRSSICSTSTSGMDDSLASQSRSGRRHRRMTKALSARQVPTAVSTTATATTSLEGEKGTLRTDKNRRALLRRQTSVVSSRRILALRNSS